MDELKKIALVTGAAGNLGRAVAARLAADGVAVVALDRLAAPLEAMVAELEQPGRHMVLAGVDLLDAAECDTAVRSIIGRFGRLDGVAHTVGGFAMADIAGTETDLWQAMFRLNVLSTANIFGSAIAAMRKAGEGGSLVAVGAIAGLKAPAGMAAYAASKSAVLRLVESYADELKPEGLRVNAVMPGTMDTPQNRAAMPDADPGAWVKPEQVAATIAFLLSDAASGITAAAIPVIGRS